MICIEGNIGAGKTTLIRYLQKKTNYPILEEPIDKWINVNGVDLIKEYYSNPKRYAYHFQSHVIKTLEQQHLMKPHVMERGLLSSKYCFTEVLLQSKYLSEIEYKLLESQYLEAFKKLTLPNLIIYLRSDPEITLKYIHARNRTGESHITKEYLRSLHEKHEDWLINRAHDEQRPILIIGRKDFFKDPESTYIKLRPYLENEVIPKANITSKL